MSRPLIFFATYAVFKHSITIIANNAITITLPTKPVSSPTTEKIKSVCCSDTKPVSATATTGRLIEEVTNLTIHKYLAGPLGGEQQMASQIEHNLIDMVIFLRDPQNQQVHEPDIFNVMHLCDVHNIPLATNLATAELLVKALERGDLEWREMYR